MKTRTLTLSLLLAGSLSLQAADSTIKGLTDLTSLATDDSFVVVDKSDTTQSAQGTTKDIVASDVGLLYISDTAYSSAFNAITTVAPSKNALYDQLHIGDADDDGKIDVIDSAAAGFFANNSSGAFVASRTLAEDGAKPGIDITNPTGAAADPAFGLDLTEVEATTWGAGGNASNVWTFNLSGTDPVLTLSSGVFNVSTGTLQQGGVDVATISGSQTLTTKTIDSSNNIIKMKSYPQFTSPLRVDGTKCTIGTTPTTLGYGLGTFDGAADEASNWMEFRIIVPADWDTGVDPKIRIIDLIGADTSTRQYSCQVLDVAASASATGTPATKIDVNMSADGSGASGDIEVSSQTTLTGWGSALTPGHMAIIRINRDGDDASDASNISSTVIAAELEYGVTQ